MGGRGGYYESPWPCEDGGPRRLQHVEGLPGLDLGPGDRLETVGRRMHYVIMVLLRDPGEVYAMQMDAVRPRFFGRPMRGRVSRLDPETLATQRRSPRLLGGPFWAGGFSIHRNGDLYVTHGRFVYRLDPDCQPVASYRLPVDLPYNSHVLLDNGLIATKSFSDTERSVLSVLDPDTLEPVCAHVEMPEPSIARIAADGDTVYVVGTRSIFRYHWDAAASRPVLDDGWRCDYVGDTEQDYGWDPVIDGANAWFLDNGRHEFFLSMIGAARTKTPSNFVRVALDDASDRSIEPVCGAPRGAVTNPPFFCPRRSVLVAYDSSNCVTRAWRYEPDARGFEPLWEKRPYGTGGHMLYYPDSGELVTNDYRRGRGDSAVVLDLESGTEKGRARIRNLQQGLGFSAPGWGRDFYWVGVDKLARVHVA